MNYHNMTTTNNTVVQVKYDRATEYVCLSPKHKLFCSITGGPTVNLVGIQKGKAIQIEIEKNKKNIVNIYSYIWFTY